MTINKINNKVIYFINYFNLQAINENFITNFNFILEINNFIETINKVFKLINKFINIINYLNLKIRNFAIN